MQTKDLSDNIKSIQKKLFKKNFNPDDILIQVVPQTTRFKSSTCVDEKFKDHTLQEYLDRLSAREPVPGGGSAAALSSALGAGLICMVTRYSLGKGKPAAIESKLTKTLAKAEDIRARLLELVDEDAEVYLGVVAARKLDAKAQKAAAKKSAQVPKAICRLSYDAVELTPLWLNTAILIL